MIKTLSPYSTTTTTATSKTAEIMSRYRPIAPKPEHPMSGNCTSPVGDGGSSISPSSTSSSMSQKIRQSPYLRNLWPQLQARPTRTRKRGRAAISPPTLKRQRAAHQAQPQSLTQLPPAFSLNNTSLHGFTHGVGLFNTTTPTTRQFHVMETQPTATSPRNLVTLPLLPCSASSVSVSGSSEEKTVSEFNCMSPSGERCIDLNSDVVEIPEEKDLLQQLQGVPATGVIAPQPVRPIGSSISVGCISEDPTSSPAIMQARKKREEVEEEVEAEILPAVVSDANNKVRLANSAYKEMVGQPECSWLDSMVFGDRQLRGSSRISGEVVLRFCDDDQKVLPVSSSNGFCCWVMIEWGDNEGNKRSIKTFCNVSKLACESKDYVFTWKFHTHTRQPCQC